MWMFELFPKITKDLEIGDKHKKEIARNVHHVVNI